MIKHCEICGKDFKVCPAKSFRKHCSLKCMGLAARGKSKLRKVKTTPQPPKCKHCVTTDNLYSQKVFGGKVVVYNECCDCRRALAKINTKGINIGRKHTEAAKAKISAGHKGQVPWIKGRKIKRSKEAIEKTRLARIGTRHTMEARRKISIGHGGTGVPYENYDNKYLTAEWGSLRRKVYKRDNYTCQECGKDACWVAAHHIDYNTKNNDMENLITLCRSCHGKTLTKRGYWKERYVAMMEKADLITRLSGMIAPMLIAVFILILALVVT